MKKEERNENKKTNRLLQRALAIGLCVVIFAAPIFAQGGNTPVKTNTKITYHNGPVMQGSSNVYVIWYGNWSDGPGNNSLTQQIVLNFLFNVGSSQYFQINVPYVDALGNGPNGGLIYSGTRDDSYSKGAQLSTSSIQEIVTTEISLGRLPLDGAGIYLVIASSDVSANDTGFCTPNAPPHHGVFIFNGAEVKYGFIGNPRRCWTLAAPHLPFPGPTPNDDFSADGIVNTMAALLSAAVTNPTGSGWFDRYGLENSTKCQGIFGDTYSLLNGSRANIQLGTRHYLIQQNWVNSTRKGYCAMAPPTTQ